MIPELLDQEGRKGGRISLFLEEFCYPEQALLHIRAANSP